MKKYLLIFTTFALISACQSTPTLHGSEYQLENSSVRLSFSADENQFYGKAVNNYFGNYQTEPQNRISFQTIGTTMMMGSIGEMQEEETFLYDLSKVNTYDIQKDRLILKSETGKNLIFDKISSQQD